MHTFLFYYLWAYVILQTIGGLYKTINSIVEANGNTSKITGAIVVYPLVFVPLIAALIVLL